MRTQTRLYGEAPRLQITEIKRTLDGRRKEFACELCSCDDDSAIVLYRLKRDIVLAGVAMPAGTLSFGHYWRGRNYNVYHWIRPNGQTAAYYFNLADETSITAETVDWRDLAIDLMVTPDGACQLLDEDELPADLDPALRAEIDTAVSYLLQAYPRIVAEVEVESRRCMVTVTG
jgi:hypothetical protein